MAEDIHLQLKHWKKKKKTRGEPIRISNQSTGKRKVAARMPSVACWCEMKVVGLAMTVCWLLGGEEEVGG